MFTEGRFIRRTEEIHVFMRDPDSLTIEAQRLIYEIHEHPSNSGMVACFLAHHEIIPVTAEMRMIFMTQWKSQRSNDPISDEAPQHQTAAHA